MNVLIFILLLVFVYIVSADLDPCLTARPLENVSIRGTACIGTLINNMVCDRQLETDWYYAEHNGVKLTMPTICPSMFSCGTASGLWLNGNHPSNPNETASINVCLRGLTTDENECCTETFPINVKNCGQFFVYQLTFTTTCDQAYCFGDHSCQLSTTSTTSKTTSTTQSTTTTPLRTQNEPNQCRSAKPINKASLRGTQCVGTELSSLLCDRQMTSGWYYAEHEGRKLVMPSTCPDMFRCGTGAPIWIKDSHPTSVYETVDVAACIRGLESDDIPCCTKTYPVKITNCGEFFVYYLSFTDTCAESYCFGEHDCNQPFDNDEHEDEGDDDHDSDHDKDPWHNKSGRNDHGMVLVTLAVIVCIIIGIIVVVIIVKRSRKRNKSSVYMENQKQSPQEKKTYGLPAPEVVSGQGVFYPVKPPIDSVWSVTKTDKY